MTSQLLTEIQITVNSSPITLGKVATQRMLYMQIHSHQTWAYLEGARRPPPPPPIE